MDRKEFLNAMGMSAAALALLNCVGCKKNEGTTMNVSTPPSNVNLSFDLSASANSALLKNGGSLVSNGIIVAKTLSGNFIAVQQSCTHETYPLTYQANNSRFYCPNHGATFAENGAVTNGPAGRSLVTYKTQLNGNTLLITS